MAQTSNYGLGKPDPTTTVAEEIERLITTWDQLDLILKTLADAIATKAAANHNHAIGTITGLTEALAGKMAASKTFAVADLSDISGSAEAALGYILAKTAMGFSFQSAASLLGNHQHGVADIVGLTAAIDAKIAALVAASPATLDTLAELATALGNDPNFATTMAAQIADAARLTTGTVADARLPARLQSGSSLSIANQAEAEAGAENTKAMTALRVKQAILALAPTKSGSAAAVSLTGATSTEVLSLPANIRVLNVDMVLRVGGNQGYQSLIQLGDASAYAVSGYQNSQSGSYPNSVTAGIDIATGAEAIDLPISVRATRLTGNLWAYQVLSPNIYEKAGTVTLSGELTRLKYVKTAGVAPINNSQMRVSWEF